MLVGWHTTAAAGQLTLTWADGSADEQGVSIERALGTPGTFREIVATGPDVTSYIDSSLADATTYCYRVRAFNAAGSSDYSNTACAATAQMFGLAVLRTGAGSGTITSAPAGITCGGSCSGTYPAGTSIALTANAVAGSMFSGWSGGGCSGTGTCSVTLNATTTVLATFALQSVATSFSDNFQRTDSAVLAMGWTEPQGDFFIRNGSLWNGTEKTRNLAVQSSLTMATGRVTAEFTSLNNNAAPAFGLVFGFVDARTYYAAYRQVGGSSMLKIVRVTNGVETVLAQRSCANPVRGSKFDLAVSVSSSQVVLTGGGQTLTATGISVAPGKVGVMVAGGGTSQMVDDFQAGP
jgi:hypothetical protein